MLNATAKPAQVDFIQLPDLLWWCCERLLPTPVRKSRAGRKRADNRAVLNGIWYVLWTSCQWKAIQKSWFGVCSSTLHARYQEWVQAGVFEQVMRELLAFYDLRRGICWEWQAIDSKSCPAPLGHAVTGKNPTDRAKLGSKLHLLVDGRGAPLSIYLTGANVNDKWLPDELILGLLVPRPDPRLVEQHLCADKGYDYDDVRLFAAAHGYHAHIPRSHRYADARRTSSVTAEPRHPARRWVIERTFSWLAKRRSLRTRWCKKAHNWLAFLHLACAHILLDLAIYG
jgi:putative transposase